METLVFLYKDKMHIRHKKYLLEFEATSQQHGTFRIEFDGTTINAFSFSDECLEAMKKKFVELFGYPPFLLKKFRGVFGNGSIVKIQIVA